ncbi:MAG: AraC family transcriptional regulator [Pseudomonadota bacterium]|uniref:helix-turn-helix domain-containing protein n=1 Tax=Sphingomonas sp. ERG5 TaxID=1381597 RepID=UPI00054BF5EB|nr:AraC family transcriptional regulator [Sphingomonas sp. ERG5]
MLPDPVLDRLLVTLDVAVDMLAMCDVRRDAHLIAGANAAITLHYVLSGTLHLTVGVQPAIVCGPGSVVLVPPGMTQSITADTVAAAGDLRIMRGLVTANISGSFGLLDAVTAPIVENLGDLEIVRLAYTRMIEEVDSPDLGSRALIAALMKMSLLLLLRRHFIHAGHSLNLLRSMRDPRLGRAIGAVLDKPASAHSVASLAGVAGMSRSAFAREFSGALDMSPMAFVTRTRLRRAADLLGSTGMPIKVIAATIGFASRSHFSRAFAAVYGMDPSAFRATGNGKDASPPSRMAATVRRNGGLETGYESLGRQA